MSELRYSRQQIDEDDIAAVVRALRSDWLTQGPEVAAFEADLCAYTGARYAVAVSSGTAALHLCMLALAHSFGQSMVLTSPLSFVASANAALLAGHEVDFTDVDRATGLMDWRRTISRTERRFNVVIPVHYAGRCCDMSMLQGPVIIEDGAHAIGATCFDGCGKVGNCAHSTASCFSFHAVKGITTGEGGAITTNDQGFANEVRMLREHGRVASEMVQLGLNYRMTDIQAALGRSQLQRCDEMRERRAELTSRYYVLLRDLPVTAPRCDGGESWHLYAVRIWDGHRDAVKAALNAQDIGAQIHYPCIHLQPYYARTFGYHADAFPEAEAWSQEELSLPLHAGMREADVTRVVDALRKELA